jgi:hypothetical protein
VHQRIDLVIEARNVDRSAKLKVTANGVEITNRFAAPVLTELDCDGTPGAVFRADLFEFERPGFVRLSVDLESGGVSLRAERELEIKPFAVPKTPRNYILFIGDAMGNASLLSKLAG